MKLKGAAQFFAPVGWVEQGEKPAKYFFNLEKRNFNCKVITEIKQKDGKTIVEEHILL